MDPPEFRTSRSRANPLGLASASLRNAFGFQPCSKRDDPSGDNYRGGPIAPAFVGHRALFQSDEGHTKALARHSTAIDTGCKRQALAGRAARAGAAPNSRRTMGSFPQRTARRKTLAQAQGQPKTMNRHRSLSRVRAGIRLCCLLSTAWRPPTKDSAEKEKTGS